MTDLNTLKGMAVKVGGNTGIILSAMTWGYFM